jgi:hypothetical protein
MSKWANTFLLFHPLYENTTQAIDEDNWIYFCQSFEMSRKIQRHCRQLQIFNRFRRWVSIGPA